MKVFWRNGGGTFVTNLIRLCGHHHSLIHKEGWNVTGNPEPGPGPNDTLVFHKPDGSVFVPHPAVAAALASRPDDRPGPAEVPLREVATAERLL